MIHEAVDIASWIARLPLARLRAESRRRTTEEQLRQFGTPPTAAHLALTQPRVHQVVGPYDVAVLEQLRAELRRSRLFTEPRPVDVFIYARGEAPRRDLTKTAGLPYWPRDRPWPVDRDGQPMTFVLQLCFADSLDLTGPLPGDVLLLFLDAPRFDDGDWDDPSVWHFVWQPLGLTDLVDEHDLPASLWRLAPFYAARYRTVDYVDDEVYFFGNTNASNLFTIEATKLGGQPHWVQGPEEPYQQLRFLASVGSNNPNPYAPWPYLNVEQPLNRHQDDTLDWGDVGSLYLFRIEAGELRWTIQGY